MATKNRRGIYVTRRCRKNGRRFVEMVCHVHNYQIAAEMAREFNNRDPSHIYVFSWREASRQAEGFWSDMSEDFDPQTFFKKFMPAPVH